MSNFETRYNVNNVTKVFIRDARVDQWYKWKEARKIFGFTLRKQGFYFCFLTDEYVDKLSENLFAKDKVVYEKPCVVINFIDESQRIIYFDTIEEANQWCKNQLWILESHFKTLLP